MYGWVVLCHFKWYPVYPFCSILCCHICSSYIVVTICIANFTNATKSLTKVSECPPLTSVFSAHRGSGGKVQQVQAPLLWLSRQRRGGSWRGQQLRHRVRVLRQLCPAARSVWPFFIHWHYHSCQLWQITLPFLSPVTDFFTLLVTCDRLLYHSCHLWQITLPFLSPVTDFFILLVTCDRLLYHSCHLWQISLPLLSPVTDYFTTLVTCDRLLYHCCHL